MTVDPTELVRLERPASGGAVGRLSDGRVVFVRHAIDGELVKVRLRDFSSTFARGDALEILEPSAQRVGAPCPYAHPDGCGGCDLQHVSSEGQLRWKSFVASEQLRRIGGVDVDVEVVSPPTQTRGYRTRLRCVVSDHGRLGLRAHRSHDVVVIDECWVGSPRFRDAFSVTWTGCSEVELRAIGDGPVFAVAWRDSSRGRTFELRTIRNEPMDATTMSRPRVGDDVFEVGPTSFWQAHVDAPDMLQRRVLELLEPSLGDVAVDLYCGVGLLSVPLLRAVGSRGRVTAIESSPAAVRDARRNLDGRGTFRVRQRSVTPAEVAVSVGAGDLVVVDPPRSGLGRGVAQALCERGPGRVVYVSCDVATFARDVALFARHGYHLGEVRAYDLFPMTEHVEIIGLLDTRP